MRNKKKSINLSTVAIIASSLCAPCTGIARIYELIKKDVLFLK
jgi:hypothetical protein